eukprot:scaffold338290_cov31-Attheya_sp.AAC.1
MSNLCRVDSVSSVLSCVEEMSCFSQSGKVATYLEKVSWVISLMGSSGTTCGGIENWNPSKCSSISVMGTVSSGSGCGRLDSSAKIRRRLRLSF